MVKREALRQGKSGQLPAQPVMNPHYGESEPDPKADWGKELGRISDHICPGLAIVLSTHAWAGHVLRELIHQFQLESRRLGQPGEAPRLIQPAFW